MAMAETVRARAEELRTRVRTRIEEIRGGGSSSSGGILGNPGILKGPLAAEIKEKGVMATARGRIEKIRGGAPLLGGSKEEATVAVEKDTGALKIQRGKVAIEA
jgi:hypothetical protein